MYKMSGSILTDNHYLNLYLLKSRQANDRVTETYRLSRKQREVRTGHLEMTVRTIDDLTNPQSKYVDEAGNLLTFDETK